MVIHPPVSLYNEWDKKAARTMTERERLVKILSDSHEAMQAALDAAPRDVPVAGEWTIKEVIDHLTGWDDITIQTLRAFIDGEMSETTMVRVELFNKQIIFIRRGLALEQSVAEWKKRRERLLWLIRQVPDDKLGQEMRFPWGGEGYVRDLVHQLAAHESEHAEEIIKAVEGVVR